MEVFLNKFLPRVLPTGCIFKIHAFQGKQNLLKRLKDRLRGYARYLPDDCRLIVMVDCDNQNCQELKEQLEQAASAAGLRTRSQAGCSPWQLVNRIVIRELEAWYFGDWHAVRRVYPRVPPTVPNRRRYRDADAIRDTWEAFESVLRKHGYFKAGLNKIEAAQAIGVHIEPERAASRSFMKFYEAVLEAV